MLSSADALIKAAAPRAAFFPLESARKLLSVFANTRLGHIRDQARYKVQSHSVSDRLSLRCVKEGGETADGDNKKGVELKLVAHERTVAPIACGITCGAAAYVR